MEFVIHMDEERARNIERTSYEIERVLDNISFLINDNLRLDNPKVNKYFTELCTKCADYDDQKDKISADIVIPAAAEKWGEDAQIAWSLEYHTCNLTISYTGSDKRSHYASAITVDDTELLEALKSCSIKDAAYMRLYSRLASNYPTLDNDAYKEFVEARDTNSEEFFALKKRVENEYAQPWVRDNADGNPFDWALNFETGVIDINVT